MKKKTHRILSNRSLKTFKHGILKSHSTLVLVFLLLMSCMGIYISCKKDSSNAIDKNIQAQLDKLDKQTSSELQQAWEASNRYQNIENAFTDKYADIHVVMPNMGYHYMKSEIVDTVFDPRKPELLVYNKRADSSFQLVAVEYAVPLDQSVNAPEGFTGTNDVWDHNTDFGLWLLHAWVWSYNPDGIFHPTNPQVQVR